MHRIDTEGHDNGRFQEGTPQIGQQGTILGSDWLNDVQENIAEVIEAAGQDLEKGNFDQLRLAIQSMISSAVAAGGAATRVRPGIIEMFGGPDAPFGYLECDGAVVLRATYPDLFAAIGTAHNTGAETGLQFRLPDLRGEFVRGWDHGRGVDAGRTLASTQGDAFKAHSHSVPSNSDQGTGNGFVEDALGDGTARTVSTGSAGGAETRPRNVALMFVIKI